MISTQKTPAAPKSNHYVSNADFFQAMKDYKQLCLDAKEQGLAKPKIPTYVAECLYKIANKLSYRPNFINYTYRDEMIADGLENCVRYFDNFDTDKSNNPFSYFTQIIYYAFLRRIQKEKKQVYVKHRVYNNQIISGEMTHLDEFNTTEEFDIPTVENTDYIDDFVRNFEAKMAEKKTARTSRGKKTVDTILQESESVDSDLE